MKYLIIITILFLTFSHDLFAQKGGKTSVPDIVDPTLHLAASTMISFTTCVVITRIKPDMKLIPKYLIAGTFSMLPGFGKEYYDDKYKDSPFDWVDVGFDAIGVGSGILIYYLFFDRVGIMRSASLNYSKDYGIMISYSIHF
jgi:hypothetical protein